MRDRPSLTARHVAAQRSRLDRPSDPDGNPDADRRLETDLARWLRLPKRTGVPMQARTAFFDDATREAIGGGVRQVVILGAGYDGRALRFAHRGVRFFEVDHPQTQADKRRRVLRLGVDHSHISYVGVDLSRDDLAEQLGNAGFDAATPTLFTCEGLLPYLTRDTDVRLLGSAHAIAAPGSRLAVNFHVRPPGGAKARLVRRGVDGLLAVIGEPRLCAFGPGDPERLLQEAGWRVSRTLTADHEADQGYGQWVLAAPLS